MYCYKLKKEADALEFPPIPGPLGEKILKEISQEAWDMWTNHQTMLINEYRLSLSDKAARDFLSEQMKKFLFTDEDMNAPEAYEPTNK